MITLSQLKNTTRPRKKIQRVGRGPSSKRGKTCCRGVKGAGSRSGWKKREGYEGGQMRLFMKLPTKGFTRGRFIVPSLSINLGWIEKHFAEGETVSLKTLLEKGIAPGYVKSLKILAFGELKKKVKIEANSFSKEALAKLGKDKISYKVIND